MKKLISLFIVLQMLLSMIICTPLTGTKVSAWGYNFEAVVLGDWQFARTANGQRVQNGDDAASGQIFDSSGNGNNGVVHGAAKYATYTNADQKPYYDGYAIRLQPESEGVQGGNIYFGGREALNVLENFSGWARVNFNNCKDNQTIMSRPGRYKIFADNGKLSYEFSGFGVNVTDFVFSPGAWYDIGFSFEGKSGDDQADTIVIYVNGIEVSRKISNANFDSGDWFHIGAVGGGGYRANALFDRVMLISGVLRGNDFSILSKYSRALNLPEKLLDFEFAKSKDGTPVTNGMVIKNYTVFDSSGNDTNSAFEGTPKYATYSIPQTGVGYDGFAYDTRNDSKLYCPNSEKPNVNKNFSAWTRIKVLEENSSPEANSGQFIIGRAAHWGIVREKNTGKLRMFGYGNIPLNNAPVIELNKWYDIGVTFDGDASDDISDVINLYVNGVLVETVNTKLNFDTGDWIHIAGHVNKSMIMLGLVDRATIYNGIVTESDMAALSGVEPKTSTLPKANGKWDFNKKIVNGNAADVISGEQVNNNLYDGSGNGNTGDKYGGNTFPRFVTYTPPTGKNGYDGYAMETSSGDGSYFEDATKAMGNYWFNSKELLKKDGDFAAYIRVQITRETARQQGVPGGDIDDKEQVLIASPNDDSNQGWRIYRTNEGKLAVTVNNMGEILNNNGPKIEVGQWYDIALSLKGKKGEEMTANVYFEGERIASVTKTDVDITGGDWLHIGGGNAGSKRANALYDRVIYYDAPITDKHAAILTGDKYIVDTEIYTPVKYEKKETAIDTLLYNRAALIAAGGQSIDSERKKLFYSFTNDYTYENKLLKRDYDGDFSLWFGKTDATIDKQMIERAMDGVDDVDLKLKQTQLFAENPAFDDARWLGFYFEACKSRRNKALAPLMEYTDKIVYAKHFNMGGSHYAYTDAVSDNREERNFSPGSALCMYDLTTDEEITLLEDAGGVIRNPDVSFDATKILFSWKKSLNEDDYHLYEMDIATREIRQLTFGIGYADYEAIYLPDGNIMFNSTRGVQTVDCLTPPVANFYIMDGNGNYMRRIGFDQVHTNFPVLLNDGRVVYTRWDYNDRAQIFTQGLFVMNPDGTNQTEFYGNNSFFPTALLHARPIPNSTKVMATFTGHHSFQAGKVGTIDVSNGRQENEGTQLIAPVRETKAERIDAYGQEGPLFDYPYPINDTQFMISYAPDGLQSNRYTGTKFGLYFMDEDGNAEEIITDSKYSINQPIPVKVRKPFVRPSMVDYRKETGTYYMQDVYQGQGMDGVPRGTAKKLRIVEIQYRAKAIADIPGGGPGGGANMFTPISIGNGAWDTKHIIGDVPIYEDGSALFTVPARTPVYFQVLDENDCLIQTMRSWSTLMPNEVFSCVGCHENKNTAPIMSAVPTMAMKAGIKTPVEPYENSREGFSFNKQIQPILDKNCVSCHYNQKKADVLMHLSDAKYQYTPIFESNEEWKYTIQKQTGTDWIKENFDDSAWAVRNGPLANQSWPVSESMPNEIWIRRTFNLTAEQLAKEINIKIMHDEDTEIYINGVLAASFSGYNDREYIYSRINGAAKNALRVGTNTIAVSCKDTGGGRRIDVGLVNNASLVDMGEGAFNLKGDPVNDYRGQRTFTVSYLTLTNATPTDGPDVGCWMGLSPANGITNWISSLSTPQMLPPYSGGSGKSMLIEMLEEGHGGVNLTNEEKYKLKAWIDLVVPFCGDYKEANLWSDADMQDYDRQLSKRDDMEQMDIDNVNQLIIKLNGENAFSAIPKGTPEIKKITRVANGIELSWKYIKFANKFKIFRSEDASGEYTQLGVASGTSYIDDTVLPGKTYYYKVIPTNNVGDAAISEYKSVTISDAVPLDVKVMSGDTVISSKADNNSVADTFTRTFEAGDKIVVNTTGNIPLRFKLNDMQEAIVFTNNGSFEFTIPKGSEVNAYDATWFQGDSHKVTVSIATPQELKVYRNVAFNPYANRGETATSFPFATASSECYNAAEYAARNAIDGYLQNKTHGGWLWQSWGPDKVNDIEFKVEFGRTVEIDKIGILYRHDGTHDINWKTGTLEFSDGTTQDITMTYDKNEQFFTLPNKKNVSWVKLKNLVPAEDKWIAITEFAVYGKDI